MLKYHVLSDKKKTAAWLWNWWSRFLFIAIIFFSLAFLLCYCSLFLESLLSFFCYCCLAYIYVDSTKHHFHRAILIFGLEYIYPANQPNRAVSIWNYVFFSSRSTKLSRAINMSIRFVFIQWIDNNVRVVWAINVVRWWGLFKLFIYVICALSSTAASHMG